MPTTLSALNPAIGEIKVRWREPYVTEGLNAKLSVLVPSGTYRGFRLAPHVDPLTITIEADADSTDHVAHYRTVTGYALTIRRTGGDFAVLLDASSTLVIALYATYVVDADTTGELRSYTLAEWNALTVAQQEELVVLGTVTTPGAGVIPAADITHVRRAMAWESVAPDARPWPQVLTNPTFDYLPPATSLVGRIPGWSLTQGAGDPIVSAAEVEGLAVELPGSGGAVTAALSQVVDASVSVGQFFRVRVSLKCSASATGALTVNLYFRDPTTGAIGGAVPIGTVPVNVVDASYREVDIYYQSTVDGRLYSVELDAAAVNPGVADSVRIRSVECCTEAVPGDIERLGTILARHLDLTPPTGGAWSGSTTFARVLGALLSGTDPAVRVEDSSGASANVSVSGYVETGDQLVGSDTNAALARSRTYTRSGVGPGAPFTLIWESLPNTAQPSARLYADAVQNPTYTYNARYDVATSKWVKDVNGVYATYAALGGYRGSEVGLSVYLKSDVVDVPWDHSNTVFDATHWTSRTAYTDSAGLHLGAYDIRDTCGLRLTLQTATPIPTADIVGASTLYLTPYTSNRVALYYNSEWRQCGSGEVSLALAGLTSNFNYDVFAYWTGSAVALELAIWTDDTTRATALTSQDGVLVSSADATRRYIGTIRASSATTSEDSRAQRFVWNYYNRVPRGLYRADTTDSWNYSIAAWRQANANTANKVEYVVGAPTFVELAVSQYVSSTVTGLVSSVGIGFGSTVTNSAQVFGCFTNANLYSFSRAEYKGARSAGYEAANWLEAAAGGAAITFYGDVGVPTYFQFGMTGSILG